MNQIENIHSIKKTVSTSTVSLVLGLLTALVLTIVLNSYVDLKSTFNSLSMLENYNISLSANVANANTEASVVDKWHPGIYVKVESWQLNNPVQMENVYRDLESTPALRGIKVTAIWGEHETRNVDTGISTFDFSKFQNILSRLETMDNKHLIIIVPWREFKGPSAANILPNDMRGGQLWSEDPSWEHIDYDYLWAYKMVNQPGNYAYNFKLWDTELKSRFNTFLTELAKVVDSHPNFNQITTSESTIGEPIIPFVAGESSDLQYAGQTEVIRSMKQLFPNSFVVPSLNFTRAYVAGVMPVIENEIYGLGTPDMNLHISLNSTGTYPGILTYFPVLSGKILLAPEIQSDNLKRTYGPGSEIDNPPYDFLYKRVRDDLKANYVVIQRTFPYWYGSSTASIPSMLSFIQTYPDIINDTTGAGGLDHVKPAKLLSPDLSFNASPTEVYSGESSILSWSVTNATNCEATGAWSGTKSLTGFESINNILATSTYTLTCTGNNKSTTKNVTVGIKIDTELPTVPNGLSYNNIKTDSVTLNWSPATDNIAVTKYNIYRDGVKVNSVSGTTTYTDTSLSSGTTYVYNVTALDAAGNESLKSLSVSVTTKVITPFSISTYNVTSITRNSAVVNTTLSKLGNVTIRYSRFSSNLNLVKNSPELKTNHSVTLNNLDKDKTYYYQITATDQEGNTVTSPIASFRTKK